VSSFVDIETLAETLTECNAPLYTRLQNHSHRSPIVLNTIPEETPLTPEEFAALMRLLDDETPEVRARVSRRLQVCDGDISEWIASWPGRLNDHERKVLSEILGASRRSLLEREWLVPTTGAAAMSEDWDAFEATLRLLSDFLHDGLTVRQSLSDALDLLAEEAARDGVTTARDLGKHLFKGGILFPNELDPENPNNADLAWAIIGERATPLSLGIIFILTGRRMGLEVEGVEYPEYFLCRVHEEGVPLLIDCFDHGCLHFQMTLFENPALTRQERAIIRRPVSLGAMLLMLMKELTENLTACERHEDARLIRKLRRSLR
jgi:hypothetical protein